ncbi:MAG: TatD family deoxyribonuclease [Verrucomicrobiae bacterium]|nr:TatD family deoxyribonuclease [Verrucomicrobiae bacterium]
MLIDTHAHLDYPEFAEDFDQVLQRARDAGVTRIIAVGVDLESSERCIQLAEKYPGIYASVGVHPTEAASAPGDIRELLHRLAEHPRAVAIGETGLDYFHLPSKEHRQAIELTAPRIEIPAHFPLVREQLPEQAIAADTEAKIQQRKIFLQSLEVAATLGKAVIIHQRDSLDDTLSVLREFTVSSARPVRGVFHCFGGTKEQAERILDVGFHVSFTGILTFKKSHSLRAVAEKLPLDRIMVETDCPYLSPEPVRNIRRCEPAFTRHTAEKLAETRGLSLEAVAKATTANAERLFGLTS